MPMKTYDIQTTTRTSQPTAVAATTLAVEEIPSWLGKAYSAVAKTLAAQGTQPAGPPFARYHKLSEGRFEVEAGFPVLAAIKADGEVRPSSLPGGMAATTMHVGSYGEMEPGYEALAMWVKERGQEIAGDAWEIYMSDPAEEPDPAEWRTEIVQPYRPT
jgi:effector-binding domain-containing protein